MEFVDNIPDSNEEETTSSDVGLEIGMLKFKNKHAQLELENVKITDLEGLRNLLYDVLEEFE